jgi:predicted MFS family arabinose efflux permease
MNPWRGLNNIPRNVWIVAFSTLINRAGSMVIPFLVIYITTVIGVSTSKAGLVLAIYGLGGLCTSPFMGKLSDKLGALRIMKTSLIFTGIILILYSFVKNFYGVLLMTLLLSVISEAFRPANLALLSNETEPEQRKTAFALNRLMINLGMSVGPVVGGFLSAINFSFLFYVDGATSILAAIFLMSSHIKPKKELAHEAANAEHSAQAVSGKEKTEKSKTHKSVLRDKRFLLFMLAIIPVELVFFQHLGVYPLYIVKQLGHSTATFGLLIMINTVLIILTEVPLNNAMSNWNDAKLIALGSVLCAVGYGAMVISGNIGFIAATIIIWTFGEMIFFPASASFVSSVSPEDRRGEYMGYFQTTFSFSLMLGPWFGTLIFDHFGSTILWSGAFVFGMVTAVIFMFWKHEHSIDKSN